LGDRLAFRRDGGAWRGDCIKAMVAVAESAGFPHPSERRWMDLFGAPKKAKF
jgi:hypothetical protein